MEKTKKQILLFIVIILVGVGYVINEYIIAPEKLVIEQKAEQIRLDNQKLSLLKSKSSEAIKLTEEVAILKQGSESIADVTVEDIDTPQLIFDFYSSCIDYGIKGENLVFQLADDSNKEENPESGTTDNSSADPNISINQTEMNTEVTTTTNETDDINKSKVNTGLLKLSIQLKVSGDKNKVETYIRKLKSLTARKMNVLSIKVESIADELVINEVTADIMFNQYIYNDGKKIIRSSNYSFYNENLGFSNFADMFK
jgi:type IV pilus assembly protein PilO